MKKRKTIRDYARGVMIWDTINLGAISLITYLLNYGEFQDTNNIDSEGMLRVNLSPQFVGLGLYLGWLVFLVIFKTRDVRIVGSDFSEYRRVFNASLAVLGTLAFVALFFKVDVSRVYVTEVMVVGTFMVLLQRRLGRVWLLKQRKLGNLRKKVAIYGPLNEIEYELNRYASNKEAEFEPVVIIPDANKLVLKCIASGKEEEVDLKDLPEALSRDGIELLQVVGSGPSTAKMHTRLYWALDGWDIGYVVSPAITGVSSSKLTTRVIAGVPQLEITSTKFSGPQYLMKTIMDIALGLVAFVTSLPIILITALLIKLDDKGPAFFTQTRVGLNGKHFTIYKLRSMKVGAELQHAELQAKKQSINSNMYKDPEDPRVTKIGRFIRKYSIDELPQFMNVLKGDMSLVGPRPPLLSEVEQWQEHEVRRLLVKPGVTGPWQVGGRSLLTWEETVAIDLSYVENWTVLSDLAILMKTVGFVFRGRGAF